jgi:hypothetical protein
MSDEITDEAAGVAAGGVGSVFGLLIAGPALPEQPEATRAPIAITASTERVIGAR